MTQVTFINIWQVWGKKRHASLINFIKAFRTSGHTSDLEITKDSRYLNGNWGSEKITTETTTDLIHKRASIICASPAAAERCIFLCHSRTFSHESAAKGRSSKAAKADVGPHERGMHLAPIRVLHNKINRQQQLQTWIVQVYSESSSSLTVQLHSRSRLLTLLLISRLSILFRLFGARRGEMSAPHARTTLISGHANDLCVLRSHT